MTRDIHATAAPHTLALEAQHRPGLVVGAAAAPSPASGQKSGVGEAGADGRNDVSVSGSAATLTGGSARGAGAMRYAGSNARRKAWFIRMQEALKAGGLDPTYAALVALSLSHGRWPGGLGADALLLCETPPEGDW